jgi:cephalosporin hydroxylase
MISEVNDNEDIYIVGDSSFFDCIKENDLQDRIRPIIQNARWCYYMSKVWADQTLYMGIETMKFPTDMWVMQEILYENKPDVLIETGTWKGGSALYYAHLMDAMNHGWVLTVDNDNKKDLPIHDRILYLTGDCLSKEIVDSIKNFIAVKNSTVMVNLDSSHTKDHVLKEMELYGPLVTEGQYMVVEDGIVGHPIKIKDKEGNLIFPGPYEAIEEFLSNHSEFECDRTREKFQVIANIKGYLKRKGKNDVHPLPV